MKKSALLVAALTLVSGSAFASKARMAALSNAAYLTDDTQSIFDNIARITQMGDFATIELGETTTRSLGISTLDSDFNALSQAPVLYDSATGTNGQRIYAADAEGGFVMSHGDHKFGFYMGRKSQFTTLARSIGGFLGQENTIELMYGNKAGEIAWGVSANYSSADKKGQTVPQKESAYGVRLGAVGPNWDAYGVIGLGSSADGASKAGGTTSLNGTAVTLPAISDTAATYRGTAGYKFGGGYWLNDWYLNANYYQDGAKINYGTSPGATYAATGFLLQTNKVEQTHWEIGAINALKNEGSTFFYGFYYAQDSADNKENSTDTSDPYKLEKQTLPVLMGMEVSANSWLTLRGSVKQNVLLSSKKYKGADANTVDNSTTAAAGLGVKWNKLNVDATIAKALQPAPGSNGNINQDNLLSNVSLTYMF